MDAFIYDLFTFQNVNENEDHPCSTHTSVENALEDEQWSDTQQARVDIYSQIKAESEGVEAFDASMSNYVNDSETVAWSKMQVAVAEAYQNGSSESQAKYEAQKAIDEYYAVKQRNIVARWNAMVFNVRHAAEVRNQENVSAHFLMFDFDGGNADQIEPDVVNHTVTLVNGSTVTAESIKIGTTSSAKFDNSNFPGTPQDIFVKKPTDSYDSQVRFDVLRFHQRFQEIQNKRDSLVSESDAYINSTYSEYESGNINASDVISTQTAMFEYGTRSGGANESLYDSVGALALAGYESPSLNGSGTMDVVYQNQTYTGIVMARTVPGGSWSTNTTYNTSNFDGPVFIATTTGKKVDIAEGHTFRIKSMRARDGSPISSVNTTRYNYKTANASELASVTEQLSTLRSELESRDTSGGAGGGSGGMSQNAMLILLAVAAGAALVYGQQNGGNGGGRRGRR
ncbi:hypothetical protein [Haloplanus salinarum]|uniref:hypothetical protein n=1 Tax=Haloplanus salinarum TaxID=1912324 RepID=UPI00214C8BE9|nr:hypothetical protein [Haloplanus salinarum]